MWNLGPNLPCHSLMVSNCLLHLRQANLALHSGKESSFNKSWVINQSHNTGKSLHVASIWQILIKYSYYQNEIILLILLFCCWLSQVLHSYWNSNKLTIQILSTQILKLVNAQTFYNLSSLFCMQLSRFA